MNPDFWTRVRAAFDAGFDAAPDAVDEAVRVASGGDGRIAAEARALLGLRSDGFLESGPPFVVDPEVVQAQLVPGTQVDGYTIVRLIGRGGMGEVYEAIRTGPDFKKRVAVKVLRGGTISPDAIQRFERERRILAGLEHRNIAALSDGGLLDDGRPFFVMEFVEGARITTWCRDRALDVAARLLLFRQVGGAVSHAHRNLIVHRDLKPGNIMVAADGTVKLLDFGIAKVLEAGDAAENAASRTATVLTPDYAAPEQLTGGPITTATDVYALGLLLFELLTGTRPFAGSQGTASDQARLVLTVDPPLPSSVPAGDPAVATRAAGRALRGDLDAIVLKALRRDPAARYASVDQLLEDLARHERRLPVEAMRGHRGYRAARFVRRHRGAILAAGALGIALVAGVASTWRESRRTRIQQLRAEATTQFLTEMLSAVDPNAAGKEVSMAEVLDSAAARITTDSTLDPEVEASLRNAIGTSYHALGKYDAAEPHLRRAVELRARSPGEPLLLARAYRDLGQVYDSRGEYSRADSLYQLAVSLLPAKGDSAFFATVTDLMKQRARMQSLRGDLPGAESILTGVVARVQGQFGARSLETANAMSQLAVTVAQQYHFEPAESLTRSALAIYREQLHQGHPDIGRTLGRLATILELSGERAPADSAYRESLAILGATLGTDHPDVAWIRVNYAGFLADGGEWTQAIVEADSVLRYRGTTIPETHPGISTALQQRALAHAGLGDHQAAIADYRDALAVRRRILPAGHWMIGSSESSLGAELLAVNARAEGLRLLREGCRTLTKALGADHPNTKKAVARLVAAGEVRPSCG